MPDTITPPKTGGTRGGSNWFSQHKGLTIGGGIAALVVLYLVIRSRNNAANAAASQQSATATPQYPYSTGITGDTNFGDYYAGLLNSNQALANQISQLGTSLESQINGNQGANNPSTQPTNTGSPSASAAPPPPPPPSQPGLGIVPTAQGNMVWLGVWGQPEYQVGGGAPVYFGNASNLAQGNPQIGQDVYTPVAYSGLVSKGIS